MRSWLVTGGAGFIGSNIVAALKEKYPSDRIIVCDAFGADEKWRNLAKHPVDEVVSPQELFLWLEMNGESLEAVIHMGAISSTTEQDTDLMLQMNYTFSRILHRWCTEAGKRFIYASSAATYGAGENGFADDMSLPYLEKLLPLNKYALSKQWFDYYLARRIERGEAQPPQSVGLKFFNVYGPNEYHKADQKSVIAHIFPDAKAGKPIKLFKSYHPDYKDGGQLRDFIYVHDCVNVVLWLLENPQVNGLLNVGTGKARSFLDLANAVFAALGEQPNIEYIDMPDGLKERYQYYTQADIRYLGAAGYTGTFTSLEDGVKDYVANYLNNAADSYR